MSNAYGVIKELSEAMVEGRLDVRGDTKGLKAKDAEMVTLVNNMIDAMVAPMHLAGHALDEIAHGRLPAFVIDDYQGEYNQIKQNINTLLATLYGMHGETTHLIESVSQGKLKTRGNDWDYHGIWKELIGGVNNTLDAVMAPINEASKVLEKLAEYDLKARMRGKYRGEHAVIRKAMNATAEALHEAISKVSETVNLVSEVGGKITTVSSSVSEGAAEQSRQLGETSASLSHLSESASRSAEKTISARDNAKKATDSIISAKSAMDRMVRSMGEICEAADDTATIVQEIDFIAKETGTLAGSAVEKAARMRTSAGGFAVVAQEIRKLSKQCSDTASNMMEFEKQVSAELHEQFSEIIARLQQVAKFSNLLGVNAAIEAAHVEGAGNDFKIMTDEIHNLAVRTADAAKRTDVLIKSSVELSKNGETLIKEIDQRLEGAVEGAGAIREFADEISQTIQEQTTGLEQITKTAEQINSVTHKNAASASESLGAAKDLQRQVEKLSSMVDRFKF